MITHFDTFPQLQTEKLQLRNLRFDDRHKLLELRSDEQVNRYIGRPAYTLLSEAESFITKIGETINNNQGLYWVITTSGEDALIGTICFYNYSVVDGMAEIGFELLPAYQGRGLMHEALQEVIKFGFEKMRLHVITAEVNWKNEASVRLLEKVHFKRDYELREDDMDYILYELFASAYQAGHFFMR